MDEVWRRCILCKSAEKLAFFKVCEDSSHKLCHHCFVNRVLQNPEPAFFVGGGISTEVMPVFKVDPSEPICVTCPECPDVSIDIPFHWLQFPAQPQETVRCVLNCGKKISRGLRLVHYLYDCRNLVRKCPFCEELVTANHIYECQHFEWSCPTCPHTFFSKPEAMARHMARLHQPRKRPLRSSRSPSPNSSSSTESD